MKKEIVILIDRNEVANDAYKQFPQGSLYPIGSKYRAAYEANKEAHLQGVIFAEQIFNEKMCDFALWCAKEYKFDGERYYYDTPNYNERTFFTMEELLIQFSQKW